MEVPHVKYRQRGLQRHLLRHCRLVQHRAPCRVASFWAAGTPIPIRHRLAAWALCFPHLAWPCVVLMPTSIFFRVCRCGSGGRPLRCPCPAALAAQGVAETTLPPLAPPHAVVEPSPPFLLAPWSRVRDLSCWVMAIWAVVPSSQKFEHQDRDAQRTSRPCTLPHPLRGTIVPTEPTYSMSSQAAVWVKK